MPFCANCGLRINDIDRFCQQCGALRVSGASVPQAPTPPPPPLQYAYQTPPAQVMSPSKVITVMPQAKITTPVGSSDIFTVVFTTNQAIFAKLTGEILQGAMKEAQAQGKASGKGWLSRANDQMRAKGAVHERYFGMSPAQILAETSGNFAIDHASVAAVGVKVVYEYTNQDVPRDPYAEVEFATNGGILKFRLRNTVKEVAETLNNLYPGRMRR